MCDYQTDLNVEPKAEHIAVRACMSQILKNSRIGSLLETPFQILYLSFDLIGLSLVVLTIFDEVVVLFRLAEHLDVV